MVKRGNVSSARLVFCMMKGLPSSESNGDIKEHILTEHISKAICYLNSGDVEAALELLHGCLTRSEFQSLQAKISLNQEISKVYLVSLIRYATYWDLKVMHV